VLIDDTDGVPRTIAYDYNRPDVMLHVMDIDLSGGSAGAVNTLSISANNLSCYQEALGANGLAIGAGAINQSGGVNTITGDSDGGLFLGYFQLSTGLYNLSGAGALSVSGNETIGYAGAGTFTQSGGTNLITANANVPSPYLSVAQDVRSNASYTLTGGSCTVSNALYIGGGPSGPGGAGTFTVGNTGNLSVSGTLQVYNTGQLNINGGTAGAAVLNLSGPYVQTGGAATFAQITGGGPLTISGGTTTLSPGGGTSQISSLTLGAGGTFDITHGNTLVVNYGSSPDPAAAIRGISRPPTTAASGPALDSPAAPSSRRSPPASVTTAASGPSATPTEARTWNSPSPPAMKSSSSPRWPATPNSPAASPLSTWG
jgi:hypothetical protein